VAFAINGGRPKLIISGKVIADPLDATVLRKPLQTPANTKRSAVVGLSWEKKSEPNIQRAPGFRILRATSDSQIMGQALPILAPCQSVA
jgi:hypothetical protein